MTMTSKPSGPPNHPSDQESSTKSWKTPEPADVLSYAYLWADEAEKGQEEGLKDRPVVVVVARTIVGNRTQLFVAPVTHREPDKGEGIEVPPPVKRHLGLDQERSWIVTTELNRFTWPGPDIRIAPGGNDPFYGTIPAKLFEAMRSSVLANAERFRMTKRTE
jgi:hypothetical protein